ncbi:MAG: branched-chain amino acid ABC transporter permease [Desulfonatronovibrionaceae bacterium]
MLTQQLVNGLVSGSAYALVALGYALIYGVLGLINLAQGELYMIGAFGLWAAVSYLGLGLPGAVLAGLALAGAAGLLMERLVFRPLRGRHPLIPMLGAVGLSIVLQSAALLVFGPNTRSFPLAMESRVWDLGLFRITSLQIMLMASALILMLFLLWFVKHSRSGKALEAVSMDREAARMVGINTNTSVANAFFIGAVLSGAGGMMMAAYYNATFPYMGILPGLKGFCAAVLGGAGSITGAIIGGLLLGVAESLGAAYFSSGFKDGFAFALLILILLFKPTGLLGRKRP